MHECSFLEHADADTIDEADRYTRRCTNTNGDKYTNNNAHAFADANINPE
jgi:hypothetical protein